MLTGEAETAERAVYSFETLRPPGTLPVLTKADYLPQEIAVFLNLEIEQAHGDEVGSVPERVRERIARVGGAGRQHRFMAGQRSRGDRAGDRLRACANEVTPPYVRGRILVRVHVMRCGWNHSRSRRNGKG